MNDERILGLKRILGLCTGFAGYGAIFVFEALREIGWRGKSHTVSNLADCQIALDEQLARLSESCLSQKVNGGAASDSLHLPIELNTAERQFGGNVLNTQVAVG